MYRVRIESKQEGRKKVKRVESLDSFQTMEEANKFIDDVIKRQESLCWKSWGIMLTEQSEENGKRIAWYRPGCIIYASLTHTFEIVPA